ncbi:C2 domain-containing protein [Rhodofomes roseus]|uniref:C2 domain-containing protein n=1 Tax=Rhodofomes roseus TaxID=34475 RepID=A0ABQ8KFP3_9APHY|nr:C2 domain-containing protein [Rhodofomes roseus]KAH9836496.1 C2 domain-containing protein [Rhodofomes roseus]
MPGEVSSSPQAQAQVNGIVQDDVAKNRVAVHTFDPNASPEAKGAAAGKGKEKLKPDGGDEGAGEKEISVDTGTSNVVPTITIEDMSDEPGFEVEHSGENAAADPEVPGAIPSGPASVIPEWYKVGWREVGGIDAQRVLEGEEKDKFVLQAFIKEQYYGEWYHNAAIIVVSVVVAHFMTRFNFGWGWLFVLLAFCNTYYTTSMTRVRRRARDDIQRELVKTRLESEFESADWMNNFLDRFWLIYEPVLSQTIIASVDQILSTNCPSFLESLRMSTFTLGTKAPRIDRVKTSTRTADDVVLMDWAISFTPNDESELTKKQADDKVNPKIVLAVRVGKGIASATIPILLENIEFTGVLRVRMKLMTTFPHVQLVDLSFTEKPHFDWVLKPIGGETFGFDIGFIPGLSSFIRDMVHATLAPMMYEPNVFTLNLEQLLSGAPLDTAVGVLQITVQSARGLKGNKIGGGTPDPYVSLSINNRSELARTKYKQNTTNPTWMESKFLLVNNLTESLILSVMDYNDHRKDSEIGNAMFDLSKLREDATLEGLETPILKDGKEKGNMRFDVTFYPILKPEVDSGGKELLPMDTKVGIVRLTLHQAKDLDHTKSMSGELNPFLRVYTGTNNKPIFTTNKVKHTNNPVWDASTEFLCTDRGSSVVTVKVVDDRDFLKDPIIGYLSVRLEDLLKAAQDKERDWWPLSHCNNGRLRLSAEWKPLNMPGSVHGVDQYVAPIGVVRLWLKKATDVKNVEAALGGKSDPYVRVQINNITQGRTEVVNNNLNPEWDQIIYIPVHSLKETMMLEAMDYQHLTKDRSLGYVELKLSDLAKPSEGEFLFASTGKKVAEEPIMLDHGSYKGKLHYEAEFVPAIPVKGIGFESGQNEIERATNRTSMTETEGGTVADDRSSTSSLRRERATSNVIEGITVSRPLDSSEKLDQEVSNGAAPEAPEEPATNGDVPKEHRPEEEGLELSKEELLNHQSGVIIFNVISGQLHKKARLEVLLDDAYWPAFSTVRPRSHKAQWEYIGEGFVKELDFGRVWLRLNEADEGDKDDVVAEWKGDAKPFLERAMDGPTSFELLHSGDEDKKSVVQLEARYLPVPVKLEPRESVNNQGMLRVDLIDAHDLLAVDRGGKSDPFAVFQLNGHKVYKSQTKKKTLNPEWGENFVVQVPSRVSADFFLEVYDWDQLGKADILGSGKIDLTDIEPFESIERVIQLSLPKHGQKGSVRIRLLFQPEIIVKTRKNTSTFSAAGRAMTQIGHMPTGVVLGAGKGVAHVGSDIKGIFKSKDHAKAQSYEVDSDRGSVVDLPAGQASQPINGQGSITAAAFPASPSLNGDSSLNGHASDRGTLRVVVMDAKDMSMSDVKPYVVLRVGDKEHKTKHSHKTATPEWNESFTFSAAPATQPKMHAWIYDHKTLGKDKLLGSAEIDVCTEHLYSQRSSLSL